MVSLEITSIGSFFLCEIKTSSHQKASKNQSETKRNGVHCHLVQARGIFSVPCCLIQFTRATPKLEQKPQHIIKRFFGVLSVRIFIKISRDVHQALQIQNLRILSLDCPPSFIQQMFIQYILFTRYHDRHWRDDGKPYGYGLSSWNYSLVGETEFNKQIKQINKIQQIDGL